METETIDDNEAKVQGKYDLEQQKQAEEDRLKEAEKNEHDEKYYVVHGATCVCNKAEDPTKEAKIVVTSHKKLVINDSDGKFAVTEDDKTMDPPAATYGKCTLKPSSSGNMPCAPAFGPKWDKTYDKKVVSGKTVLTEISTLQCTVGGVVSIKKHGQTNTVVKEHAENTDPVEQMLINPAVEKPVAEQVFPVVNSITLKSITGRTGFAELNSLKGKEVEKIRIRKNEECIFNANLKSGNKDLTSWVIYEGDKKSFVREQSGTQFQNAFLALGTYRVEGYGKPKSPDYNNGEHDKNYTDCSIDVEVVVNKLEGSVLGTKDGGTFTRMDKSKTSRLRQNFPAVFEAKFLLAPNEEELQRVKIYAKDEAGNILTDGKQTGNSYVFTPTNTTSTYTVVADYTNENGATQSQTFTGKTESLSVLGITSTAEVIRPETAMKFSVDATQYKTANNITSEEGSQIKWNLNGRLVGTGSSLNLPGSNFLKPGDYVVEAFVSKANAFGPGSKDEADDWRFSVKNNDVVSFTQSAQPKVGKKFTLKADKFIMNLNEDEKVVWDVIGKQVVAQSIDVTIATPGKQTVVCRINRQPGVKQTIDVKQAEITDAAFTDLNGVKTNKASWGHKGNIYISHKELNGENFKVQIIDDASGKAVHEIAVKSFNGALLPIAFDGKIKTAAGNHTKFHIKIDAPELTVKNEEAKFPKAGSFTLTSERKIFDAMLGEQNASKKHMSVDYDKVSWFYAHTTGIPANEELTVEVWEAVTGFDNDLKYKAKAKVDQSGVLKCEIKWSKIAKVKKLRVAYIQVKDKNGKTIYDADGEEKEATVNLLFSPSAVKMVENKSAVVVGSSPGTANKTCYCNRDFTEAELKDLIKTMTGKEDIWKGIKESCPIKDKTVKSLNLELNAMFKKYKINRCMQKISFLANLYQETGFFSQSVEEYNASKKSSQSVYKGRGILQITGLKDSKGFYNNPDSYETYGKFVGKSTEMVKNPNIIAENLHYAVDVGGWVFSEFKEVPTWSKEWKSENTKKYEHLRVEKVKHFSKGLGKSLTELGILIEEDEKYFWLQAKMLNGYSPKDTLKDNPHGWEGRKNSLAKLKTWFKYDKNVCQGKPAEVIKGRAPWMNTVIAEAKGYGGRKQKLIQDRVSIYHKEGASYDGVTEAWCSSFACWCLENSKPPFASTHNAASRSFVGHKNFEKCEEFFGAIATFADCSKEGAVPATGSGHVTFVYGKLPGKKYAVLGGNQNSMIKVSSYDCSGEVFYSHYSSTKKKKVYKKFMGFFKPKGYVVKEDDKLKETDNYKVVDDANKKIGLSSVKTVSGERDD